MNFGFHNISMAEYLADKLHDRPSLSSSVAAILLRESPLKAWYSHPRLNPAYRDQHDDKFDIGTVAHSLLLEQDESKLVILDADDWRTKAAKEARDAARSEGKVALLARHAGAVRAMVKAARTFLASSEVAKDWQDAESEVTALAEDEGTVLRVRLDRITRDRKIIFDYKTTTDVSPDGFGRQLTRMGYNWQEAFYRHVVSLLTGQEDTKFVFLAQSVEPPHECTLHGCDPGLQEISDYDVGVAIRLWRDCLGRNEWPSYDKRIHWAMPTTWQMTMHEQRMQYDSGKRTRWASDTESFQI